MSSLIFLLGGGGGHQVDPLTDTQGCLRDLKYFKELGINTLRVYAIDNTKDHHECMDALANAGIYVALDVNNYLYSINREDAPSSYNARYLQSVFATVDIFAKYDNTLLFMSGNEIVNAVDNTQTAPYIKATTRDIKNYINSRNYRKIPVGYSAADVDENQLKMGLYMACGDKESASDFYAINDYSWCQPSSYQGSGWPRKVAAYANYGLPLL